MVEPSATIPVPSAAGVVAVRDGHRVGGAHAGGDAVEPVGPSQRLRLLGGFDLRLGDVEQPTAPIGQRIVAWLALRERPAPRARIAGDLWPRADDVRARANLRSALWRLRETAPDLLADSGAGLGIAASVGVDVRSLLVSARGLIAGDRVGDDVDGLVGMLSGELLPGWYDDWLLYERERLRQLALHAMEALCRRLVVDGDVGRAVEVGVLAVRREPLRESAHRCLIEAHLAEDNVAEAIAQYDRLVVVLGEELDIGPSPRTRQLLRGAGR